VRSGIAGSHCHNGRAGARASALLLVKRRETRGARMYLLSAPAHRPIARRQPCSLRECRSSSITTAFLRGP
jgi:hypothetical protein